MIVFYVFLPRTANGPIYIYIPAGNDSFRQDFARAVIPRIIHSYSMYHSFYHSYWPTWRAN